MSQFFKLQVDLDDLTDAMHQFVTEPTARRNDLPIVQELDDVNPDIVDILECMVLDGTEERQDVADYVNAVFGPHGLGAAKRES
jgi:hypothetical protein